MNSSHPSRHTLGTGGAPSVSGSLDIGHEASPGLACHEEAAVLLRDEPTLLQAPESPSRPVAQPRDGHVTGQASLHELPVVHIQAGPGFPAPPMQVSATA